jgi:MYXO-CTERM domain-containing protein
MPAYSRGPQAATAETISLVLDCQAAADGGVTPKKQTAAAAAAAAVLLAAQIERRRPTETRTDQIRSDAALVLRLFLFCYGHARCTSATPILLWTMC